MLMLRPSAIIAWTAGTPSAVAGIFTNRLGCVDPLVQLRGRPRCVAWVSRASSGATSIDTNPSVPPLASNTGRRTAERVDDVVDDQLPVGVLDERPAAISAANCSS